MNGKIRDLKIIKMITFTCKSNLLSSLSSADSVLLALHFLARRINIVYGYDLP